jgi:hypothetical protein
MGAFCCPRADESKNLARAPFSTYIIILVGDGRLLLWRSVSFRPRPSRSIVPGARGPNGAAPGAMKDERQRRRKASPRANSSNTAHSTSRGIATLKM